jgi:hypothetical protein
LRQRYTFGNKNCESTRAGSIVVVHQFHAGKTGLGVACCILWLCCGVGFVITLIYGWVKAKEWNINPLMTVYTIVFIGNLAMSGARYNEIRAQVDKALQKEQAR